MFGPKRERVAGGCTRSFITVRFNKHCYGDQIKEDEVDGSRIRMGEMRNTYTKFLPKNPKGRAHPENLGV
jgi:hypothetical protein